MDQLAAVLTLAVGGLLAAGLLSAVVGQGRAGDWFTVAFAVVALVWVTRTMTKAAGHLRR